MINKSKQETDHLLSVATPQQYLSFLFDLQLALMAAGHFAGYTNKGFEEHALYMGALKEFFEETEAYSDIKKG